MKFVVIKINRDVINEYQVASAVVGYFDSNGTKQMELLISGSNFVQKFGIIKPGQELKLIPAEIVSNLASLQV